MNSTWPVNFYESKYDLIQIVLPNPPWPRFRSVHPDRASCTARCIFNMIDLQDMKTYSKKKKPFQVVQRSREVPKRFQRIAYINYHSYWHTWSTGKKKKLLSLRCHPRNRPASCLAEHLKCFCNPKLGGIFWSYQNSSKLIHQVSPSRILLMCAYLATSYLATSEPPDLAASQLPPIWSPFLCLPEWPNCSRTWWRNNQTPMVEYHAGVFVRSGKGGTMIIVDCWCTILQLCRLAFRCSVSPETTPICYSINRRRWPTMTPPLLELYAKVPRIPGRKSPK